MQIAKGSAWRETNKYSVVLSTVIHCDSLLLAVIGCYFGRAQTVGFDRIYRIYRMDGRLKEAAFSFLTSLNPVHPVHLVLIPVLSRVWTGCVNFAQSSALFLFFEGVIRRDRPQSNRDQNGAF
jgi:hypothetical protein